MATLNWKTPNGTTGSLDLSKVVTSVATGSSNGTIAVNGTNVAVKGLGSAAYTASTAYAAASHTHSYLPLSGGTLTGNLIISKTDPTLILYKKNITRATAPSAAVNKIDISARDSADKSVWGLYSSYGTDKSNRVDLVCYKGTTTDNTWASIGVGYDASGNAFTYAPTPAQTDSTTKIATTAHVKACVPKAIGSATQPVYTNANGVVTACTYTLSKSVPSNAVFTDHTYSNFVKSGSTAAAGLVPKPSTTAGTTHYLREDGTWTVPPNTTYSNFVKSGSTAAAGLVPKPSTTAGTTKYLREDGTWQVPPDNNTTYSAGTAALLTTGTDTTNRVWTAKILSDFVKSKCTPGSSIAANGYVKLDSGLIIQWGTSSTGWTPTVTFPIEFTTACYAAVCSTIRPHDGNHGHNHVWNVTKTGMTLIIDTDDDNVYKGYWIAIGK